MSTFCSNLSKFNGIKEHSTMKDLLNCLNLLNIDESVIDNRLETLIKLQNFSKKHLGELTLLLRYKLYINEQENDECDNNKVLDIIPILLRQLSIENIDKTCEIINLILSLNLTSMTTNSEHILQQLLSDFSFEAANNDFDTVKLLNLKICDSLMETLGKNKMKASLFEVNLDIVVMLSKDEKFCNHFLVETVPKIVQTVSNYDILNSIWDILPNLDLDTALKVICTLSNYYIPLTKSINSVAIEQKLLWKLILKGLTSDQIGTRKMSLFILKTALKYLNKENKEMTVIDSDSVLFHWSSAKRDEWEKFIVLYETLEEKQSNIIMPTLPLLRDLDLNFWSNILYSIGLNHESFQVKLKCLEIRLQYKINDKIEANMILNALNDIKIYKSDLNEEDDIFKRMIDDRKNCDISTYNILQTISGIKWSPVPLHQIVYNWLYYYNFNEQFDKQIVLNCLWDILKVPCNIPIIRIDIQLKIGRIIKNIQPHLDSTVLSKLTTHIPDEDVLKDILSSWKVKTDDVHSILQEHKLHYLFISDSSEVSLYNHYLQEKIQAIKHINTRKYSDKLTVFNDFHSLCYILWNVSRKPCYKIDLLDTLNIVFDYITNIVSDDGSLNLDIVETLCNDLTNICSNEVLTSFGLEEKLLSIHKLSIEILKDLTNDNLVRKSICLHIISTTMEIKKDEDSQFNIEIDICILQELLNYIEIYGKKHNSRLVNKFYENLSKASIHAKIVPQFDIKDFVNSLLNSGGYNCLENILNIILRNIDSFIDFEDLFKRLWSEILEIKSNKHHNECMTLFIKLLLHETFCMNSQQLGDIIKYLDLILDNSNNSYSTLYQFTKEFGSKISSFDDHTQAVVMTKLLLFNPVLRKDQRITDTLIRKILLYKSSSSSLNSLEYNSVWEIRKETIESLSNRTANQSITREIIHQLGTVIKNKKRYHEHSQTHLNLFSGLQAVLLMIGWIDKVEIEVLVWSVDLLCQMPHQPSVRVLLEVIISRYFVFQKTQLTREILEQFKINTTPMSSQLMILYFVIYKEWASNTPEEINLKNIDFCLDFCVTQTMGPNFNTRLLSQHIVQDISNLDLYKQSVLFNKYEYTVEKISDLLKDFDVDLKKYNSDFSFNRNLKWNFKDIFYSLPSHFRLQMSCELINLKNLKRNDTCDSNDITPNELENCGYLQKKYVPNTNDDLDLILFDNVNMKKPSKSELIVVASLVDKIPNLGGMARTSEVFGVQSLVINSLRHLKDQQFQGLSVSAERWVDVLEVRPDTLKEYLLEIKHKGYMLVAAEQTSNSVPLNKYEFPKKVVLVLGNEKQGVPSDILPLMDKCVEVPQNGVVRSLNVHVTAAIFTWEYARRHVFD